MQVDDPIAGAARLATHRVGNAQDAGSLALGLSHRLQRVHRLPRLGEGDKEGVGVNVRVAVAELAGDFALGWDTSQFFDYVFADHCCMAGSAHTSGDNAGEVANCLIVEVGGVEQHPIVMQVHPPADGIGQGAGLLVDLLLHKVLVATLLRRHRVPGNRLRLLGQFLAFKVAVGCAARGDGYDLGGIEKDDAAGVRQDGGDVGSEEHLAIAIADHHPASVGDARPHQRPRLVDAHYRDRGSALDTVQRSPYCFGQVHPLANVILDHVRQHLGIGLGDEAVALILKLLAQRQEVLDDAVVDDHHLAAHTDMRVSVHVRRLAVCRPAGVADADMAGHW